MRHIMAKYRQYGNMPKCVSGQPITQRKEERGRIVAFLAVLAGRAGGRGGMVVGAISNEGVMSVGFFSTTIIRKL
jgi:hypothetical protein